MKEMGGYEEFGVGSWADKILDLKLLFISSFTQRVSVACFCPFITFNHMTVTVAVMLKVLEPQQNSPDVQNKTKILID